MLRPELSLRLVALIAAALFVLAGIGGAMSGGQTLVVERVDTGEELIAVPVSNGTTIGLEYMHSVEKTRVYDGYEVAGDRLVNTRMEFESYGWGLPARANVTRENGMFVYDPPGELKELYVKPGTVANHTLIVGDRRYDLVERADASTVRIHLERRSALAAVRERFR